jgi:hypothetical protein
MLALLLHELLLELLLWHLMRGMACCCACCRTSSLPAALLSMSALLQEACCTSSTTSACSPPSVRVQGCSQLVLRLLLAVLRSSGGIQDGYS